MKVKLVNCIRCKKQIKAFRIDKRYCDLCAKKRHNELERVINRTEKAQARYKRFRNTDKYREYSRNRYKNLDENKKKARYYILNAIRDGKIFRPKSCEMCGKKDWGIRRSMIEANHYLGYDPENWLKVQWLCTDCHKKMDGFI